MAEWKKKILGVSASKIRGHQLRNRSRDLAIVEIFVQQKRYILFLVI